MVFQASLILLILLAALPARGDDLDVLIRYQKLSDELVARLESLASKSEDRSLTAQAATTRAWYAPRKSKRLTYYLPDRGAAPLAPSGAPELVKQWQTRFLSIRKEFAVQLFDLAAEAVRNDQEEQAFVWLNEIVREDPEHEEASAILGLPKKSRKITAKSVPSAHPQFRWPAGRHWVAESEHFIVESNDSTKTCNEVATELERLHTVWQQVYFAASPASLDFAKRFAKATPPTGKRKQFRVAVFKDRAEYLKQLSGGVENVGVSEGVYLDEQKQSLFFAGADAKRSTWYHEVAHQLFQEYLDAPPGRADDANVFVLEAAALYMESLDFEPSYATIGGYDAENLQFARFRARGKDFYMPMAQLAVLGRKELQQHKDIRKIYSELGGLGQFFMEGDGGALKEGFVKTVIAIYQGRPNPQALASSENTSFENLDRKYYEFLDVTDDMIASVPPRPAIRQLSLRNTSVTDAGLKSFDRCEKLKWLDLSQTQAGDAGLLAFSQVNTLQLVFLERTSITDKSLATIARWPNLEELYLSETAVTDKGIAMFANHKKLRTLDLAGCPITSLVIDTLEKIKTLESLDVSNTMVSAEALAHLQKVLPKLKK